MNVRLKDSDKIKVLNSDDIYGVMQRILLREQKIDRNREHFWVVGLATSNMILFIELISMGTVNQTLVQPMEVYSFALQKRAVKIILVHNHPSGELTPSEADKDLTDKLIQVGLIVNTPVIEHLIISEKSYLSFTNIGLLEELGKSTKYVPPYILRERLRREAREMERRLGEEQGMKDGIQLVAKAMKEKGADIEYIKEVTGLTKRQIGKL